MLVVDDDVAILDVIREMLTETGYEVVTATDGGAALDHLQGSNPRPDLILVDLMMPGVDGWQFTSRVRADPEICDVPIVFMSAGGSALLATAPPGEGYLQKPIQTTQLLWIVHRTLTLSTMRGMTRKASGKIRTPDPSSGSSQGEPGSGETG